MKDYTKERRELKEVGWQRADRTHYDPATKTAEHVERWIPPTGGPAVSYQTARRRFLNSDASSPVPALAEPIADYVAPRVLRPFFGGPL